MLALASISVHHLSVDFPGFCPCTLLKFTFLLGLVRMLQFLRNRR